MRPARTFAQVMHTIETQIFDELVCLNFTALVVIIFFHAWRNGSYFNDLFRALNLTFPAARSIPEVANYASPCSRVDNQKSKIRNQEFILSPAEIGPAGSKAI